MDREKWHATTVQMMLVLAGEMTSPATLGSSGKAAAGKKRKSRGGEGEEGGSEEFDLSVLDAGKGSTSEPISFTELAAGA